MKIRLSIIIPSYRGEGRLPELLEALAPGLSDGDEVIVVDDYSPDRTALVAEQHGAKVVRLTANGGVGRARNMGAQAASNEVICFFDDDVIPMPGYLATVRKVFADPEVVCAQGAHALEPLGVDVTLWERADAVIWHHYETCLCVRDGCCLEYYSGATCIRRDSYLELGGMSEAFPGAGGEEFEFAGRLLARTKIWFVPDLESRHRYKRLAERLRTLRKRARNYRSVMEAGNDPATESRQGEKVRAMLANLTLALAVVAVIAPAMWLGAVATGLLFIVIDWRLYFDAWRWERGHLVPALTVYRFLQYWFIALGMGEGMIRHV